MKLEDNCLIINKKGIDVMKVRYLHNEVLIILVCVLELITIHI